MSTTPAARVRPDSSPEACVSTFSSDWSAAPRPGLDRAAVVFVEIADLHQRIDEKAQAQFGRQPPGRGVRRIDQARAVRDPTSHCGPKRATATSAAGAKYCASRPARRSRDSSRRSGGKSRATGRSTGRARPAVEPIGISWDAKAVSPLTAKTCQFRRALSSVDHVSDAAAKSENGTDRDDKGKNGGASPATGRVHHIRRARTTKRWLRYLVCNWPATSAMFISEAISANQVARWPAGA